MKGPVSYYVFIGFNIHIMLTFNPAPGFLSHKVKILFIGPDSHEGIGFISPSEVYINIRHQVLVLFFLDLFRIGVVVPGIPEGRGLLHLFFIQGKGVSKHIAAFPYIRESLSAGLKDL